MNFFQNDKSEFGAKFPDVYQYETIPPELRVQVVYIWKDIWGEDDSRPLRALWGPPLHAYKSIHEVLASWP